MIFISKVLTLILSIAYIVLDVEVRRAQRIAASSVGHHAPK